MGYAEAADESRGQMWPTNCFGGNLSPRSNVLFITGLVRRDSKSTCHAEWQDLLDSRPVLT